MSLDKETERLFATFRPDMLKKRLDAFCKAEPTPESDDDVEPERDSDDVMTVAEFKEGMEKFDTLLAQLRELQSKFVGIIKAPPAPPIGAFPKKIESYEAFAAAAVSHPKYRSTYEKARISEEKVNDAKLRLFAFLFYVKRLQGIGEAFFDYSTDELYAFAHKDVPQIIAEWRIHSRDLGIPIEEYVNKYINV